MWLTGWSETWLQITCKNWTLKAPISTWVISSLFNLHIFLLWCTWGNIISNNRTVISSGLIISFFLLIFQLIWLWYYWKKFKIGYYGGCLENHTLHSSTPALMQRDSRLQILQCHRKLINLEDQARWRRGGTGCTKLKSSKKEKNSQTWLPLIKCKRQEILLD